VLRKVFGFKRVEVKGSVDDYIQRSFTISVPHQTLFGKEIKKNEKGEACSTHGMRSVSYLDLPVKPEGKIPRGRHRSRL
jgi:hypothetical protein